MNVARKRYSTMRGSWSDNTNVLGFLFSVLFHRSHTFYAIESSATWDYIKQFFHVPLFIVSMNSFPLLSILLNYPNVNEQECHICFRYRAVMMKIKWWHKNQYDKYWIWFGKLAKNVTIQRSIHPYYSSKRDWYNPYAIPNPIVWCFFWSIVWFYICFHLIVVLILISDAWLWLNDRAKHIIFTLSSKNNMQTQLWIREQQRKSMEKKTTTKLRLNNEQRFTYRIETSIFTFVLPLHHHELFIRTDLAIT